MNTKAPSEGLRQGNLLQDHTPMMQQYPHTRYVTVTLCF